MKKQSNIKRYKKQWNIKTQKIVTRDHLCWARPLSEGRQCALTRHTPAFGGESGNTPAQSSSLLSWFVFHVHVQNRVGFSCWKPSPCKNCWSHDCSRLILKFKLGLSRFPGEDKNCPGKDPHFREVQNCPNCLPHFKGEQNYPRKDTNFKGEQNCPRKDPSPTTHNY